MPRILDVDLRVDYICLKLLVQYEKHKISTYLVSFLYQIGAFQEKMRIMGYKAPLAYVSLKIWVSFREILTNHALKGVGGDD
jgi:hypothetical protein